MKKWLFALAAILLLGAGVLLDREIEAPFQGYPESATVEIAPGTRTSAIAGLLAERGIIAYRLPFLILNTVGRARHRSLKAGEYRFDHPLSPLDVYRKLAHGDVYLHTVVIPEGSDRFDMAPIFHRALGVDPDAFLRATATPSLIRDLDPQARSLEGYLFPDTYKFPRGASPAAIAEVMTERFRHVLRARFPELGQSPAALHQAVTLASLVEKETPSPAERPLIAGVFERRIAAGMLLECDPTVAYASRLDGISTEGPITRSQLDLDSPYNTYRRSGLPPGAICSPGEASLEAALHPAAGKALYFVSNNQGGHLFASTLAEHERNVARYRRQLAELRRTAEDQPSAPGASASPAPEAGDEASNARQGNPTQQVHHHRARQQRSKSKRAKKKGSHPRVSRRASP